MFSFIVDTAKKNYVKEIQIAIIQYVDIFGETNCYFSLSQQKRNVAALFLFYCEILFAGDGLCFYLICRYKSKPLTLVFDL